MMYVNALELVNEALKQGILVEKDGGIIVAMSKDEWALREKDDIIHEIMDDEVGQLALTRALAEAGSDFTPTDYSHCKNKYWGATKASIHKDDQANNTHLLLMKANINRISDLIADNELVIKPEDAIQLKEILKASKNLVEEIGITVYLMVWYESTETWFYYGSDNLPKSNELDRIFPDRYTSYCITVDIDGIITDDDYLFANAGKSFEECYGDNFNTNKKQNPIEKYVLFTCDEWKSTESRRLVGVTGDLEILKAKLKKMLDEEDVEFNSGIYDTDKEWTARELDERFSYVSIDIVEESVF